MTDKEIIKALELAEKLKQAYADYYDMKKCMPYDIDTTSRESAFCLENCTKKINRQQAEIERLEKLMAVTVKAKNDYANQLEQVIENLKTAKTEAYKEFAEQVKMEFYKEFDELIPSIMADKIDNLVKEMVGEDK